MGTCKIVNSRVVRIPAKFALQELAANRACSRHFEIAALKLLLSDPCWEPRQISDVLEAACKTERAGVVELLLADPGRRCELPLAPCSELPEVPFVQAEPLAHNPFEAAADFSRPRVLQLLVAEGRRRGFSSAHMGTAIPRGVRQCYQFCPLKRRPTDVRDLLSRAPSALHACIAAALLRCRCFCAARLASMSLLWELQRGRAGGTS